MPIIVVVLILLVAGVVLALINKYGAGYVDAQVRPAHQHRRHCGGDRLAAQGVRDLVVPLEHHGMNTFVIRFDPFMIPELRPDPRRDDLEDEADLQDALEAMDEPGPRIPYEDVKRELDL